MQGPFEAINVGPQGVDLRMLPGGLWLLVTVCHTYTTYASIMTTPCLSLSFADYLVDCCWATTGCPCKNQLGSGFEHRIVFDDGIDPVDCLIYRAMAKDIYFISPLDAFPFPLMHADIGD